MEIGTKEDYTLEAVSPIADKAKSRVGLPLRSSLRQRRTKRRGVLLQPSGMMKLYKLTLVVVSPRFDRAKSWRNIILRFNSFDYAQDFIRRRIRI